MTYKASDLAAFVASMYRGNPFLLVPYGYAVNFPTIAVDGTSIQTVNINANADFTLTRVYFVDDVNAQGFELLITDAGTNEQYMDRPTFVGAYGSQPMGNEGRGYTLPFPRFIQGNTRLSLQLTNRTNTPENPTIFLEGVSSKVYSPQRV